MLNALKKSGPKCLSTVKDNEVTNTQGSILTKLCRYAGLYNCKRIEKLRVTAPYLKAQADKTYCYITERTE